MIPIKFWALVPMRLTKKSKKHIKNGVNMKDTLKNIFAVLRGNIVFGWNRIFGKCNYKNIVRVFKGADVTISKGGKLVVGKGVAIGARTVCTVRKGAVLKMGAMSNLNSDCKIVCHEKIEIGENIILEENKVIFDEFNVEKFQCHQMVVMEKNI